VDLITNYMPHGWQAVMGVFGKMTSVVFLVVLSWELLQKAIAKYQQVENTLIWHIPIYPFFVIAALCIFLLALFSMITMWCNLRRALTQRMIFPTIIVSALAVALWVLPFALAGSKLGLAKNVFLAPLSCCICSCSFSPDCPLEPA